jgi:hypothetical protein
MCIVPFFFCLFTLTGFIHIIKIKDRESLYIYSFMQRWALSLISIIRDSELSLISKPLIWTVISDFGMNFCPIFDFPCIID